jgi:hypothetical protein
LNPLLIGRSDEWIRAHAGEVCDPISWREVIKPVTGEIDRLARDENGYPIPLLQRTPIAQGGTETPFSPVAIPGA